MEHRPPLGQAMTRTTLVSGLFVMVSLVGASLAFAQDPTTKHAGAAARLKGQWSISMVVDTNPSRCSPRAATGAHTRATIVISDSLVSRHREGGSQLLGRTDLTWDWLARKPWRQEREVLITWSSDTIGFEIDYNGTHDGGMYGVGTWEGDSVTGWWEQAGYCPTPSGPFVLRRVQGDDP